MRERERQSEDALDLEETLVLLREAMQRRSAEEAAFVSALVESAHGDHHRFADALYGALREWAKAAREHLQRLQRCTDPSQRVTLLEQLDDNVRALEETVRRLGNMLPGDAPDSAPQTPAAARATPEVDGHLRLLVADDHPILRAHLVTTLQDCPHFDIVGQATSGFTAVVLALNLRPDVVLMDVEMPQLNGIRATRRLRQWLPDVQVIGLTLHDEQQLRDRMQDAGATVVLSKGVPPDDLIDTILEVAS